METMNVESDRKLQESLAELSEANRQMDISENIKTTKDEVFGDIIYKCYKEMFLDNYTVKEICKRSRKAANAEFTAKQIEETLKLHFSIEK